MRVVGIHPPHRAAAVRLPLFMEPVQAGFPSQADDYLEDRLDLNERLIEHPAATFFVKVSGNSMIGAGIHSGDVLIVDRAVEPSDRDVVIAVVNAELAVKRLRKYRDKVLLVAENEDYEPIVVDEETDFEVWGVVKYVIHSL